MSKTYRLGVVLLTAAAVVLTVNSQSAFAQRIKFGGGSNQSSKDKKDKESDDEEHKDGKKDKDKDKDDQNNQSSQNNQGGSSSKSDKSEKSDKSNTPTTIQQLIQGGQGKSGQGQNNNQGQGGSNKSSGSIKPGFPGQPFQQQPGLKFDDGDDHRKDSPKFGSWKGDQWQGSHKMDNWSKVFGHNKKPFSSEWYKEHPRAWKYDNNKSNVWVVATVPGVYSWLGWGNAPPQYQVGYNNGPKFDPSHYGDWYPLGVYSLMTGQDDVGTRVLQLAVDRHGHINGNYFDMITDADHSVSGEIDRQTQRAEWSLNQNRNVRFRASIMRLLQPYGTVTVQLPGGEQRWQFVRLEN